MTNTMYFGELVAKISGYMHHDPCIVKMLHQNLKNSQGNHAKDELWTICSDAAMVFDKIEDLSGEHFVDWHKALDTYIQKLLNFLLKGTIPAMTDFVALVSNSIEECRVTQCDKSGKTLEHDYSHHTLGSSPSRRQG
ncbi:hypothetical protein [Roseivirga pacifica]|uniref:hypothetical protein n=1 Tax=Roseivirga pacifica TaxID=1267423 RepID=UPI00227C2B7D|nr:hypothetical protein [Roseivirga pacifica]